MNFFRIISQIWLIDGKGFWSLGRTGFLLGEDSLNAIKIPF